MTTKKVWIWPVVLCFLVFLPQAQAEDNPPIKEFEIEVAPGIHGAGVKGEIGKVGEYDVLDTGVHPDIIFGASMRINNDYFGGGGTYWEDEDQQYYFKADMLDRIIDQEFEYYRFMHRLDHDPLGNLNAVWRGGSQHVVTTHTDLEPDVEYRYVRSEMESKTKVRLPFFPGAQIKFDYRRELRRGEKQALTMSKCSACHVVGRGRTINELTEDYRPGFEVKLGNAKSGLFTIDYSYLDREFNENGATPMNTYDDAFHPVSGADAFTSRVQYDARSGALPYNQVPSSQKRSHLLKIHGYLPSLDTGLFTSYMNSWVENKNTSLDWNLDSIIARFTNNTIPNLALSTRFRWLDLRNESADVQVYDVTGTHQSTYDFQRESDMSRNSYEVDFDARYSLMRGVTLRGSYGWKEIKRDYYQVTDNGDRNTKEHNMKLGINTRLRLLGLKRPITTRLIYKYRSISDPFANVNAACTPTYDPTVVGNLYSTYHNMATADLTNLPTRTDEIRGDITWPILNNLTLSTIYRWSNEENNMAGWERDGHMPSASIWYAPLRKLRFTLSYLYNYQSYHTLTCQPVFDG